MKFLFASAFAFTCVIINSAAPVTELYWPQWRGPHGTGASKTANPPVQWSETENLKWKIKLPGAGSSTPIVWDKQIFVQSAISTGKKVAQIPVEVSSPVPAAQVRNGPGGGPGGGGRRGAEKPVEEYEFVLLSIDRGTGKVNWQKVAQQTLPHEGHHKDHGFASHSPVTDGEHLFAYFGSRGLHAFDLQGNTKWSKDLGRMQTKMGFGEGSSPALFQDTIIVNWDHEGEDFIVALNKNTGQELWRQPREEDTSWATPMIVEHGGKAQVITGATRRIRSYDLKTGKVIWEGEGLTSNAIPTPVTDGEVAYLMSGFRGSKAVAVKLSSTGDVTKNGGIVWSLDKSTPYVPSPLLYNGKIYFYSGNSGILSCVNAADGKVIMDASRVTGVPNVYASPVAAGGRIYLVGRDGSAMVIKEISGTEIESLAVNKLNDRFDASPALAGNDLILRGAENLYCLSSSR